MAAQTRIRPIGKLDFKAGDTGKLEVPRDNPIRQIIMRSFIEIVIGTTSPTGPVEDGILKLHKKIRLVMNENTNKVNVGGKKWFYVEKYEKRTAPPNSLTLPTASDTTTTLTVLMHYDAALNRLNQLDTSALVNARNLSSLELQVDWGTVSDLYGTVNDASITAANSGIDVEILEVFDDGEEPRFSATGPFRDIREGELLREFDSAFSQFPDDSFPVDIAPTPAQIMQQLILTADNTNVRADDIITKFQLISTVGAGSILWQRDYTLAKEDNKQKQALESLDTGILYIDWLSERRKGIRNFGQKGDFRYLFLTNAPASGRDRIELFVRYQPGRPNNTNATRG